ncbi:GDSL family lipolytic protein [Nitzschia inconspicua]|uniref:GDSL family lipolytic protein n=1 Tax=Nitzschia inconspicua TaxID=303405 RepID=A0A9K3L4E7_9STRA|nr:GDSL family lipolytic protein [Nitzschia inconspicua]
MGDCDDHDEFDSLLVLQMAPSASPIHSRRKLQPLSITTPQEDDAYAVGGPSAIVRIPSFRLPPIRGSIYDRYHRKQYRSWWCGRRCCRCCWCNNNSSNHHHQCCMCYESTCSRGWMTCSRNRLIMVLVCLILGGIIFFIFLLLTTQVVWDDNNTTWSSHQNKNQHHHVVVGKPSPSKPYAEDDDILAFASTTTSSSSSSSYARIRGDYSTVQNLDDLMMLAANVPTLCYDGSITSPHNSNNNRRKKNPNSVQDCPCAVLNSDDDINSRTTPVRGSLSGWDKTHERNCQLANLTEPLFFDTDPAYAKNTATTATTTRTVVPPNVVFLGDSIVERWYGTKLGKVEKTEMIDNQRVFIDLFQVTDGDTCGSNKDKNSNDIQDDNLMSNDKRCPPTIRGLPLGIAGDQTHTVLWRLENGELPDVLQPQVFFLLIGTNDLSYDWCSPENVVVGIVRIVELLLTERPTAIVLLHGLLPRTNDENGYLNKGSMLGEGIRYWGSYFHQSGGGDGDEDDSPPFWSDIQIINDELRGYALFRDRVEYMDTTVFCKDGDKCTQINLDLMPDGLHPSRTGYQLWGGEIKMMLEGIIETNF